MSKALVVGSYDEISSLIHKTSEKISIRPRVEPQTEEEKQLDGQLTIVSSLTLHHFDEETGDLEVLQVQVKALDENGEETNGGGTYCSFGGELDTSDFNLEHQEDGETELKVELDLDEFTTVIPSFAVKAAEKVLGTKLDLSISPEDVVIFQTGKDENGIAKLVVSALVPVSVEKMEELKTLESFDKETINRVGAAGISVGGILTSFNLENVIQETTQVLMQQHGIDPLSANNIRLVIYNAINRVMPGITYQHLRDAVKLREAADQLSKELVEEPATAE